jgi:O-acetyl-ADP-ribose deacetylase (regulator of RNase III)
MAAPTSIEVLNAVAKWLPSVNPQMIPRSGGRRPHPFVSCLDKIGQHQRRPTATREADARELLYGTFISMPEPLCRIVPAEVVAGWDQILAAELAASDVVDAKDVLANWRKQAEGKYNPKYPVAVWRGDMTKLRVGAGMNAANTQLLGCFLPGHRCIDNILMDRANVLRVRPACQDIKTRLGMEEDNNGECRVTPGFQLPHQYLFHTCGPDLNEYHGNDKYVRQPTPQDQAELASAYSKCLKTASDMGLDSVAFCCLSCGVFGYKTEEAIDIAFRVVRNLMDELEATKQHVPIVIFNVFAPKDTEIYLANVLRPEYFGVQAGAAAAAAASGEGAAAAAAEGKAEDKQDKADDDKDDAAK